MTFYKVKYLTKVFHLRPAEFNYVVERALIAFRVCGVSAVSQDLVLIYWAAPSGQTNITRPLQP